MRYTNVPRLFTHRRRTRIIWGACTHIIHCPRVVDHDSHLLDYPLGGTGHEKTIPTCWTTSIQDGACHKKQECAMGHVEHRVIKICCFISHDACNTPTPHAPRASQSTSRADIAPIDPTSASRAKYTSACICRTRHVCACIMRSSGVFVDVFGHGHANSEMEPACKVQR